MGTYLLGKGDFKKCEVQFPHMCSSSAQWLNSLVEGTNNYFGTNIYFFTLFGFILLFWIEIVFFRHNLPYFVCIERHFGLIWPVFIILIFWYGHFPIKVGATFCYTVQLGQVGASEAIVHSNTLAKSYFFCKRVINLLPPAHVEKWSWKTLFYVVIWQNFWI